MTVGRNQYNEADLLRMQRDAEARVRDMQRRSRETIEVSEDPRHRGWVQNPAAPRPRPAPGSARRQPPPRGEPPAGPKPEPEPEPPARDPAPSHEPAPEKKSTLIADVMSALRLDEDTLLILGLLLILINQRADTVLILALVYLLI